MRYVTCNNRKYRWPDKPVVVICLDGSEPGCDDSQFYKPQQYFDCDWNTAGRSWHIRQLFLRPRVRC